MKTQPLIILYSIFPTKNLVSIKNQPNAAPKPIGKPLSKSFFKGLKNNQDHKVLIIISLGSDPITFYSILTPLANKNSPLSAKVLLQ